MIMYLALAHNLAEHITCIHVWVGWVGCVFLLEVQYSILKSLISTCVLSYVGSREDWLLDRICESKKDCWDSIRRTSYPYQ